jgi:phosphoadenosine phosphosulfate reductase
LNDKGIKTNIHYSKDKDGNPITMWNLIPKKKMPPTRLQRYCCAVLKETGTPNRICALGVRGEESSNRKGRDLFAIRKSSKGDFQYYSLEHSQEVHKEAMEINDPLWDCTLIDTMRHHKDTIVNPIYEWTDEDIWDFIRQENIKTNPLYEKGYHRVGCVGCPLATYKQKLKEFSDYPQYKKAYINAFDKMLKVNKAEGKYDATGKWKDAESVFNWWIEENKYNVKGQISLFE